MLARLRLPRRLPLIPPGAQPVGRAGADPRRTFAALLRLHPRRRRARRWPAASVRLRLTVWYTAVLAATLVVFGAGLYLLLARALEAETDQDSLTRAEEIARAARVQAESADGRLAVVLPPISVFSAPGTVVQVTDLADGRPVARSASIGDLVLPLPPETLAAARAGQATLQTLAVGADHVRVATLPLRVQGEVVGVVQVGRSLATDELLLRRLQLLLLLLAGLALPAATGLGWALAGRALAPIGTIARTAAAIGRARDFARRVPHRGPPDELGRLAATLNGMLAELEAAHRDLAASNARLREALAAQQRFVADASHELRTPLTTIRANADVLRWPDGGDPDDRAQALADIAAEAARMSRLVDDLLTLARADAGQRLALSPTPLRPLVEEAFRQAQHVSTSRAPSQVAESTGPVGASSAERLPTDSPGGPRLTLAAADDAVVLGNADALKQVLLILLDNAAKYTPADGCVTLALRRVSAEAQLVAADTGVGIAEADLPRIFEPFFRADSARQADGSGLGLAIARWIVDQHGGRIAVTSTPGHGSTFTVHLPLAPPAAPHLASLDRRPPPVLTSG